MKNPLSLIDQIELVKLLLLKYGRKIQLSSFLEEIKKHSEDTAKLISLLIEKKELNLKTLDHMLDHLRQTEESKKTFQLQMTKWGKESALLAFLEQKFDNVELETQIKPQEDLQLSIKGAGYRFSRHLEGDLDKLLA